MPDIQTRVTRRALLAAAPLTLAGVNVRAQAAWTPQQPIRILIGYAPGGAVDILVRIVAEGLQRVRGVSVIPEIRSGAYGFIAAQAAARAAPDGYTLASAIMGMMCVAPAIPGIPIPLDLDRDLTPVTALAQMRPSMILKALLHLRVHAMGLQPILRLAMVPSIIWGAP
jgi:tripartite-type tricarboxylate transporter receptor subunit TctC